RADVFVNRYLTVEENEALYRALAKRQAPWGDAEYKDHLEPLIILLHNTGLRPKEAFTLTWQCVDLDRRSITVKAAYAKNGEERTIPINKVLHPVLDKWSKQSNQEYVFPSGDGH